MSADLLSLVASAQKADQVFLPILENALKAQKLRTTLGIFDRSRFFFNLPGSLAEYIEAVCLTSYCLGIAVLIDFPKGSV